MKYKVCIGLLCTIVEDDSYELRQARIIDRARFQLCREWPLLYDMIISKKEEHFDVETIE